MIIETFSLMHFIRYCFKIVIKIINVKLFSNIFTIGIQSLIIFQLIKNYGYRKIQLLYKISAFYESTQKFIVLTLQFPLNYIVACLSNMTLDDHRNVFLNAILSLSFQICYQNYQSKLFSNIFIIGIYSFYLLASQELRLSKNSKQFQMELCNMSSNLLLYCILLSSEKGVLCLFKVLAFSKKKIHK